MAHLDSVADQSNQNRLTRVNWVDIVKAMSIFLVVMMHSTLGVQIAADQIGWMGAVVEFARPFRIPCFMLVSGLFLHRSINSEWRSFLDRKVLHFVYFYVLWVAIQVVVKTPAWMSEGQTFSDIIMAYLTTFVQPFGTLWFIYMLPVFYLVTRMLRDADWRLVLALAVMLQIIPVHTGSILVDEFASRFVYFYSGYCFYQQFFKWSEFAAANFKIIVLMLAGWFAVNLMLSLNGLPLSVQAMAADPNAKMADLPLISLALGFAGALALIAIAAKIVKIESLGFMKWVGEHSIVIYLAFFLPMAISRILLLKFAGDVLSVGTISLLVTLIAFCSPMVFYWFVGKTGIGGFLFNRPQFARIDHTSQSRVVHIQPAE